MESRNESMETSFLDLSEKGKQYLILYAVNDKIDKPFSSYNEYIRWITKAKELLCTN